MQIIYDCRQVLRVSIKIFKKSILLSKKLVYNKYNFNKLMILRLILDIEEVPILLLIF